MYNLRLSLPVLGLAGSQAGVKIPPGPITSQPLGLGDQMLYSEEVLGHRLVFNKKPFF